MGHIQDRWYRPKSDPATGEVLLNARGKPALEKTERYGIGNRYRVRYLDPEGNEKSKTFPDRQKKRAEDFLIEVESDKREGKYIDPRAGQVSFGEIARKWLDSQTADYTSRERFETRVNVHMLPHFGQKPIGSIKPSDVQTWLRSLQDKEASETSRALYFGHLVSIFNFAIEDKKIASNPALASSVKRPRMNRQQVVPWSRDRAKAVREHLPDRYKPAIDLPAGIGIRKGELFGFSLHDVDRDRELVNVQRQVRMVQGKPVFALPKGGKTREVPIGSALLEQLDRYAEQFAGAEVTLPWAHLDGKATTVKLMMVDPTGCVLVPKIMDTSWLAALRGAGVHPHTRADGIHALRHLYASVLLDAGESIKALSKYLGHTDPGFTLRVYTHLMPTSHERTRRAVDEFFASNLGLEPPPLDDAA